MPSEITQVVSPRGLQERAKELAAMLDVGTPEEAFQMLDRGELDGMWIEVELKLVRHLSGTKPEES